MNNKKDFILKTVVLISFLAVVVLVWFGFRTIDSQAVEIEELKEENSRQKEQIEYLSENTQTQIEVIEQSEVSRIQDSVNVFIESVFNVKEDNYERRKESGQTVLTQAMVNEIFPEDSSYNIIYEYDIRNINSYVNQREEDSSAYVTFEQTETNVNNDSQQDSRITLQVFLQKEGDTWLVNDFEQIMHEPI